MNYSWYLWEFMHHKINWGGRSDMQRHIVKRNFHCKLKPQWLFFQHAHIASVDPKHLTLGLAWFSSNSISTRYYLCSCKAIEKQQFVLNRMKSLKSFEIVWNLFKSIQIAWNHLKSFEFAWFRLKSFEIIWNRLEFIEMYWNSSEIFWKRLK